jgi:hypothetical protein
MLNIYLEHSFGTAGCSFSNIFTTYLLFCLNLICLQGWGELGRLLGCLGSVAACIRK